MIETSAPTQRSRARVKNWPTQLNPSRLPKHIHREQNHLRLHRVFVTRERLHQVIRNGINQQKTGEKKCARFVASDRQAKAYKSECCRKQKRYVPCNLQIVSRDDVQLRRSDPEISRPFQAVEKKCSWMLVNKFLHLLLLFFHETYFPEFLKSAHCLGIVA